MLRKPTGAAPAAPSTPGSVIRRYREAKGWTQTDLAEKLGTSKARVSDLELWRENARPSLDWFVKRAEVWIELGVGVKELLAGYLTPEQREFIKQA